MKPLPFVLALALLGSLSFTGCAKNMGDAQTQAPARAGEFSINVSAPDADNMKTVTAYRGATPVTQYAAPVREVTTSKAKDFPLPGCTSEAVELFTGGANCCFGYYILTACPNGQHAAYIAPLDGNLGEPAAALRAYPVSDPSFMYYQKASLSFIRPDSPRLTRHLVFDNGAWRADKIGEFAGTYRTLAATALADTKMDRTAKAITVIYYAYMAGTPEDSLKKDFRVALPKKYRRISASIFEDIKKAANGFDPVKNIQ